ncbi:MAG: winged helix-turn-helix domain-containing protein [Thermoplasmata archaeon]
MGVRTYRTKLEMLRDVLAASTSEVTKTRIIGLANLNPRSFTTYMTLCLDNELMTEHEGRFRSTPRAERVRGAIERAGTAARSYAAAVDDLERCLPSTPRLFIRSWTPRPDLSVFAPEFMSYRVDSPEVMPQRAPGGPGGGTRPVRSRLLADNGPTPPPAPSGRPVEALRVPRPPLVTRDRHSRRHGP